MKSFLKSFGRALSKEAPIVRAYLLLFILGVFLGVFGIILLRSDFSEQVHFVFDQRMDCSFFSLLIHRIIVLSLLFVSGLAFVGVLFSAFFPLYSGFSLGVLIALASLCFGVRGFFASSFSFFIPYILNTFLNYFLCLSSMRLSIVLLDSLRGRGKHSSSLKYFYFHILLYLMAVPIVVLFTLWDWKVVPIFLRLL